MTVVTVQAIKDVHTSINGHSWYTLLLFVNKVTNEIFKECDVVYIEFL